MDEQGEYVAQLGVRGCGLPRRRPAEAPAAGRVCRCCIEKSLAFYREALKPLGWREFGKYDAASGPSTVPDLYGLGDDTYVSGTGVGSSIWLRQRQPGETGLYLGIVCDTNDAVDAAYAAAISAGGIDEGRPADRTYFAPGYYAANVADFDGNRLEFVRKAWNPAR